MDSTGAGTTARRSVNNNALKKRREKKAAYRFVPMSREEMEAIASRKKARTTRKSNGNALRKNILRRSVARRIKAAENTGKIMTIEQFVFLPDAEFETMMLGMERTGLRNLAARIMNHKIQGHSILQYSKYAQDNGIGFKHIFENIFSDKERSLYIKISERANYMLDLEAEMH